MYNILEMKCKLPLGKPDWLFYHYLNIQENHAILHAKAGGSIIKDKKIINKEDQTITYLYLILSPENKECLSGYKATFNDLDSALLAFELL